MERDRRGDLEWFAFYHDPIEREAMTFVDDVTALAALVTFPGPHIGGLLKPPRMSPAS